MARRHFRNLLFHEICNLASGLRANTRATAIMAQQFMLLFVDQIGLMEKQDGRAPIPRVDLDAFAVIGDEDE